MKRSITIPVEEYKHLRRCLSEALEIFEAMEVREQIKAPRLTKTQKIENKYRRLLAERSK